MKFTTPAGSICIDTPKVTIAAWTGRDRAAVDHHIAELAELGVPAPSATPLYYRVSNSLVTQAGHIEVLGEATSGEIEPFILATEGGLWLGVGSDHTDRELEAYSVAASKQICVKPVSAALWPLEEVRDHLDALILRCEIEEGGAWVPYQEGTLAAIRPLDELIAGAALQPGGLMFCGTLGAIGGVRPATRYRMVLEDPVLQRTLRLEYDVTQLPVIA